MKITVVAYNTGDTETYDILIDGQPTMTNWAGELEPTPSWSIVAREYYRLTGEEIDSPHTVA